MSDSRFHLTVHFEVYGQKFEWAPSFNWSASPGECDERISGWFADCYEKAYGEFQACQYEADQARRDAELEKQERRELARLQAKYPWAKQP